ncbi:MAG: hypothetical protein ABW149_00040 [Sedimenticola sp.]
MTKLERLEFQARELETDILRSSAAHVRNAVRQGRTGFDPGYEYHLGYHVRRLHRLWDQFEREQINQIDAANELERMEYLHLLLLPEINEDDAFVLSRTGGEADRVARKYQHELSRLN